MSETQHGKEVRLFAGTKGLNLMVPPSNLESEYLQAALNVNVGNFGQLEVRGGYVKLADLETPHSLWASERFCFVADGQTLYRVANPETGDLSLIRNDLTTTEKIYFAEVGSSVFYENMTDCGYIEDGVNFRWEYQVPRDEQTTNVYAFPTLGKYLTYHLGRLYSSLGRFLYFTEYLDLNKTRPAKDVVMMPGTVNAIASNGDLLFVGTSVGLMAISGSMDGQATFRILTDFPIMEGTLRKLPYNMAPGQGTWFIFNSVRGVFLLGPGGELKGITAGAVELPGTTGCATVMSDGMYVVTFE